MDIKHWPSRPSSRWPDDELEVELECIACKKWKPWFNYSEHSPFGTIHDAEMFYDLGGYRWACSLCIQQYMRDAGLWIIKSA